MVLSPERRLTSTVFSSVMNEHLLKRNVGSSQLRQDDGIRARR